MGLARNIGLGVVGVVAVGAAIVAARTASFKPPTAVDPNAVQRAWTRTPLEPSPVSSTRSDGWKAVAAVAAAVPNAPVAPGLVVAGAGGRPLQPVSRDVHRFQPLVMSVNDTEMIHGTNEHMTLGNLALMTEVYARLIKTAAG